MTYKITVLNHAAKKVSFKGETDNLEWAHAIVRIMEQDFKKYHKQSKCKPHVPGIGSMEFTIVRDDIECIYSSELWF